MPVVSIGLDLSPPMLRQARIRNRHAGLRTRHLVGAVETLPFRAASCDVMTCFNAVHHFDLARFAGEASRVLTPSGQLVVYTRTPEQNRRTIWGRHFPEFAARETRLHEVNDVRAALEATGAFRSVRAQTVAWPVTTSLSRLVEQVTHYHYSTFRLYSEDALRAAISTCHHPDDCVPSVGLFGMWSHSMPNQAPLFPDDVNGIRTPGLSLPSGSVAASL